MTATSGCGAIISFGLCQTFRPLLFSHPELTSCSPQDIASADPTTMSQRGRHLRDQTWNPSVGIRFRRNAQRQNAVRQPNPNAPAAAPLAIPVGIPTGRARLNLRHHIICWAVLLSFLLLYLHIGHRISFEPAELYNPRLFWRSVGAEISMAITRAALWCHGICERFQV